MNFFYFALSATALVAVLITLPTIIQKHREERNKNDEWRNLP